MCIDGPKYFSSLKICLLSLVYGILLKTLGDSFLSCVESEYSIIFHISNG